MYVCVHVYLCVCARLCVHSFHLSLARSNTHMAKGEEREVVMWLRGERGAVGQAGGRIIKSDKHCPWEWVNDTKSRWFLT